MNFDFDIETSKKGTHSIKWEFTLKDGKAHRYGDHADPQYGAERILPMWVADMDFRCAPPILKALSERVARGTFGYSMPADSYYEAVIDWMSRRYGRTIQREWIALTPGVVPAVNMLIETFIQPGDKVLIQQPVYYPFFNAIKNNGADIVSNSLLLQNGRYQMDFDDLAQKAADPAVKLTILCSPHNPVGRVWSREELTRFGEICQANDVLVVSDEVHCDLIFEGHDFVSYAAVNDTFEQTSIVCTAPSKTFNLAGLKTSNIIIPDKTL
ncbi:MAG: aminotransferase class I/II-fold pyridoxal phosphate-dependent enzyme, partial [Chloroflexi bacterium]|nr:aminotransferase class I/II-fold pyridoxal phosphate-dependent enzyme [Chloroflexota bacterium]